MSPADEYIVTYPCHVPLRTATQPFTFTTEGGESCIALFTDEDLFERFMKECDPLGQRKVLIFSPAGLIQFLKDNAGKTWNGKSVTHVIIDPCSSIPRVRLCSISQFIQHVQSLDGS